MKNFYVFHFLCVLFGLGVVQLSNAQESSSFICSDGKEAMPSNTGIYEMNKPARLSIVSSYASFENICVGIDQDSKEIGILGVENMTQDDYFKTSFSTKGFERIEILSYQNVSAYLEGDTCMFLLQYKTSAMIDYEDVDGAYAVCPLQACGDVSITSHYRHLLPHCCSNQDYVELVWKLVRSSNVDPFITRASIGVLINGEKIINTGLAGSELRQPSVIVENGCVIVEAIIHSSMDLYGIDGRKMVSMKLNPGVNRITGLPKGIYIALGQKIIVD